MSRSSAPGWPRVSRQRPWPRRAWTCSGTAELRAIVLEASVSGTPGHGFRFARGGRCLRSSFDPRCGSKALEDLACLADQRLGLISAALLSELFAVLEQGHAEVEWYSERAEDCRCAD